MSKKIVKRNNDDVCKKCNESFNKVGHGMHGRCRKCDTSAAGTWMLSYLSELGLIENDDTIENGYTYGYTRNGFLELPNKTQIFCEIDKDDKSLFHVIYEDKNNKIPKDWEDEYDIWWQHPFAKKIGFQIKLNIDVSTNTK